MQNVKGLFLLLYLFLAALGDFHKRKIPNWWILFGLSIGFLFLLEEGKEAVLNGIIGMCLPYALLFLLYSFRVLGAGDVKLLMVVGLFLGRWGILKGICGAFFFGGIFALCKLIKTKGFKKRFRYLGEYVKRLVRTGKVEAYIKGDWEEDSVIHFSLCIFFGCLPVIGGFL